VLSEKKEPGRVEGRAGVRLGVLVGWLLGVNMPSLLFPLRVTERKGESLQLSRGWNRSLMLGESVSL